MSVVDPVMTACNKRMAEQELADVFMAQKKTLQAEGVDLQEVSTIAERILTKAGSKSFVSPQVVWQWILEHLSVANIDMRECPAAWAFDVLLLCRRDLKFKADLLTLHAKSSFGKADKEGAERFRDDGRATILLCDEVENAIKEAE